MRITTNRWRSALGVAAVIGLLGGCDFIDPIEVNPNAIPTATLDQLVTGVEANTYSFAEGHLSRIAAMWTQQMAGTDRQFTILDSFVFTEEEGDDYYNAMYTGGGLIDIREGIRLAEEAGTARATTMAGILKVHEAYLIGMGASLWGDLVYREAANPDEFPQPTLDPQSQVYADVQALLTEAIGDLNTGGTHSIAADFTFEGDHEAWVLVANSLKARFYLHTGQFAEAITAAQAGIADPADNWATIHTTSSAEDNHWWEFMVEQRSGYI
ncbi:MAG: SusD/RagB family nutrient-binding outer membrane lipoprotein, partial [Gemmatimonadetes bacterium]|nr:SusD/RagB family nutrient-binding outer membrane lipoprotein [Gemmatimonadota bacterium]NIQ54347.1 SusD/RagB family nutrient-binding outer membrane lipoprotein [Gemmatimonadota bacterium]NIU74557.1 SusD/RagB family nutrient-binding outer membrane lipoprotein [Gammaproteobacteria bacterium]NIX44492.1 SusD/RagB family nutrient-binding outer membrane lipoprotein [Gemmatimonadota bacterium]NIY08722.1 SusD/RagB family nutrient-binding outer membrane lipoprotein [Gemmatimonadota bacterium]